MHSVHQKSQETQSELQIMAFQDTKPSDIYKNPNAFIVNKDDSIQVQYEKLTAHNTKIEKEYRQQIKRNTELENWRQMDSRTIIKLQQEVKELKETLAIFIDTYGPPPQKKPSNKKLNNNNNNDYGAY